MIKEQRAVLCNHARQRGDKFTGGKEMAAAWDDWAKLPLSGYDISDHSRLMSQQSRQTDTLTGHNLQRAGVRWRRQSV